MTQLFLIPPLIPLPGGRRNLHQIICGAAHTCWEWGWCETWPELPACTPRRLTPVAGPQLAAGILTRGLWARGTPSKDAGPAPPVSPRKQPRRAAAEGPGPPRWRLGNVARSAEEVQGCGRRNGAAVALPSFPEEMSNPCETVTHRQARKWHCSGARRGPYRAGSPSSSGHGRIWGLAKASDEHLSPA